LNGEKFARNFVRFKKTIKPVGKYYLQNKLLEKKIPKDIIEKTLSENLDQLSEIEELANRWLLKNQKVPKEKIYQKLSRHLLSRGFEWEKIKEVVDKRLKKTA
jgi:SOS response regulatory protein OraA/RecX